MQLWVLSASSILFLVKNMHWLLTDGCSALSTLELLEREQRRTAGMAAQLWWESLLLRTIYYCYLARRIASGGAIDTPHARY